MKKRWIWITFAVMGLAIGAYFLFFNTYQPAVLEEEGMEYNTRIDGDHFEVWDGESWQEKDIHGVNLGMGKPGAFPGEAAISKQEYKEWLEDIAEMNANTIRVYTIHPPAFYEALKEHNERTEDPIYIFHGAWVNEEPLEETLDAFDEENTEDFQQEMRNIVDVVHGSASIEEEPGHAHGDYSADVSPYIIGWIVGVEWYPFMVDETNKKHKDIGEYEGELIHTENAEPFEHWLAEQMDTIAVYEKEEYNWTRPMSFTNWVSTDHLDHPAEPLEQEDMVSVNPNHIKLKGAAELAGQFASYHVYPYYPDFLNLEEEYTEFIDHRGEENNYAGYLKDLHEANELPVLIAEFGIPASRGKTHENPFGFNQGFISEKQQGEMLSSLYENIEEEGMLGGLVFTWQDEWFKRTWNTMEYDNPDRRPFWSNAQTNEQQFGLMSFDRDKIKVDGSFGDWEDSEPLYETETEALWMDHDEKFVYFRIDREDEETPVIALDVNPNQGNQEAEQIEDISFEEGIDFIIEVPDKENARITVDAYYDVFHLDYRQDLDEEEAEAGSGIFHPMRLALNRELERPDTGEVLPFSYYETGKLRHGNANPESEAYDSLADYMIDEETGSIEMRIPWQLLNITAPGMKEIMGDIQQNEGLAARETTEGIKASLLLGEKQDDTYTINKTLPALDNNTVPADGMEQYTWEEWDLPEYEPRKKESYYILQETFANTKE